MEFIDHTGHVFTLPSYSTFPIGYEYDTNEYIFWIDTERSNKLSVNNYYMLPIRPLIADAVVTKQCEPTVQSYPIPANIQFTQPETGEQFDFEIEHTEIAPISKRLITDIHISVDSKVYNVIASSQIQDLMSKNKNISDYITIDGTTDIKSFLNMSDINCVDDLYDYIGNSTRQFCMIPFYVVGNCSVEGTWMSNIMIHVTFDDGDEEWCPITVGGEYYEDSEPLYINGRNMGIDLPKDILRSIYQSSFYNDIPNSSLYNDKIKELLLNYNHIKMGAGSFNSAIESLKWFGYGNHIQISKLLQTDNQFLNQYIHDYFDTSVDLLYSYNTFRNSTYLALQIPANIETDELDNIDLSKDWFMGENKPIMEDLFHKVVQRRYDEGDIVFYRPYYDFIFDELALKLTCLKYYYEKFFLPIHLSVHSASITHRVFANDIKMIQGVEIKTNNPPVTIADPNITVKFPGEKSKYLYNHKLYVDSNFNVFSTTYDMGKNNSDIVYYVNDVCVDIPICFTSTQQTQYYDCTLLLRKDGKQIFESHFDFWQEKILEQPDEKGEQKFIIENEYKQFVILPKLINKNFDINYWLDKKYQICLLVNGNWFFYDFTIKVPEFQLKFGKLEYKYNITDQLVETELTAKDAEYISPDSEDYIEGINKRYSVATTNLFRQINKITSTGVDFNSFMYVPSLTETNDINFLPNIYKTIKHTNEEFIDELNKYRASQIQISNITFPSGKNSPYGYNDIINGYYRLSVEESSQIKNLTITYRAFLDWNDYVKYMNIVRNAGNIDTETINEFNEENGVIFDSYIKYDFINNTIISKYPEYNESILNSWYGDKTGYEWSYKLDDNDNVIVDLVDFTRDYDFIVKENDKDIHYVLIHYVDTNVVYNYIRSKGIFNTFDFKLTGKVGRQIVSDKYLGMAIHLQGELLNGYTFDKLKYAEPIIGDISETGDYCPFSDACNDCCGNTCVHRKPKVIETDGLRITDEFNRKIEKVDKIGKPDELNIYSDLVIKNIGDLISKYKDSPVIVNNKKYLNRVHMYNLYDASGNMIKYVPDEHFSITKDDYNCDNVNMHYLNHVKNNPLTPNTEFFFQDLYKQPLSLIDFYREFFWDNGDAKLVYPSNSYFDYDTYIMHDEEYWYVVFISIMTVDNIINEQDLIAKKTIIYDAQSIDGDFYKLTSGYYTNIVDRFIYTKNADNAFVKLELQYNNEPVNIKQSMRQSSLYKIFNRKTQTYVVESLDVQSKYTIEEDNTGESKTYIVKYSLNANDDKNYMISNIYNNRYDAEEYVRSWHAGLKTEAEIKIQDLRNEESKNYTITSIFDAEKQVTKWYVYRNNENVYYNEGINYFISNDDAKTFLNQCLDSYTAQFEIVSETVKIFDYYYYTINDTILYDNGYNVYAGNYGDILVNSYTLKWARSANQFLINRMYFIDSEGINQFNSDDIIVSTVDNVNFPYILSSGAKWKFSPMSFGMQSSSIVESSSNSAIISIGNGNKSYDKGYYNVDVRYSVDAFNQHQYMKKSRILVK